MAICRGYGGAGHNRERSTHVGESRKACRWTGAWANSWKMVRCLYPRQLKTNSQWWEWHVQNGPCLGVGGAGGAERTYCSGPGSSVACTEHGGSGLWWGADLRIRWRSVTSRVVLNAQSGSRMFSPHLIDCQVPAWLFLSFLPLEMSALIVAMI